MYQLRDYQTNLINQVFASWAKGSRKVLAQLPTGGGKTVIFSAIAKEFLKRGEGVLVLAHRKELILQAGEKLEAVSGLPVGYIKAGMPVAPDYDIQVASVQSLARRKRYPEVGLVIVDEAHHAISKTYQDILKHYEKAYILGVTATPCRTDGQGFKYTFDDLVCGPSVTELITEGHLSQFRIFAADTTIKTKGVKKTAGDFNQNQLSEVAQKINGSVVPTWRKFANGKQTVVFCVDVAHSKSVAETFQNAGITAEHLDGETPDDDRAATLNRFRTGQTTVLCNCGIVSEGFDVPAIEAIQCLRPTCSLILWLQMVGRSLRPSEGKPYAAIIDHSENWKNHGLPDEDREWSLEPISLKNGRFTQTCPECNHVFKPLSHETSKPHHHIVDAEGELKAIYRSLCPNCQTQFEFEMGEGQPMGQRQLSVEEAQSIKELPTWVNPENIKLVQRLVAQAKKSNFKPGWIYYRLMELPNIRDFSLGDWRYIAKELGYKSGWAFYRWQEVQQPQQPKGALEQIVDTAIDMAQSFFG